MTMQRDRKQPKPDRQRTNEEDRRQTIRAGAGPTLHQAIQGGRARPGAPAHEDHGGPPDKRPALGLLGLELEEQEDRLGIGDFSEPSPLGLELEGQERRVGMHPALRPLDLVSEEATSLAGIDRALHGTRVAPETASAALPPVQAKPAVAAASPAGPGTAHVTPAPAASGPAPTTAPAAVPAQSPAGGASGPSAHGVDGELPETAEAARAYVERLVFAHGETGARGRIDQAILSRAMLLMHAPPEAQREAAWRAALVRAALEQVATESAALRERFGAEAGRVAERVLADSESEIAAALAGYGVPATPVWRDAVTSLLWKTGDLDLAVNAALQLSKPGKDAQAQARAEAGTKAGDDLVRAARELLGLQARLRGWIEHKQALNRQIYQKEHPSHHQPGPAAQRPQMADLDRFLQSLPPAEQPVTLPAPARPDLRLSPAEQQARVDAEIRLARSELLARWLAHEQAHPILAAFRDADGQPAGLEALAGAGADPVRAVLRTALPKLVANRQTRQALRSGALSPWALPRVVGQAQAEMGIEPGTLQARIIADEAKGHASGNTAAVAAIGLGLAVLAAVPTGGSSLAVGAELTGLALEAYLAYDSIERHQLGTSAANTHIDRARALAAEEPSLGWLAVDLLGAGLGMGLAAKAMRDAAALRHAAQAGNVAPEAIAHLDTLGHAHGLGAIGSRIAREARESAGRAGAGTAGLAADALAGAHLGALEQRLGVRVVADAGLGDGVRIQLGADGVRVLHVSVGPQARVADVLVHGDVVGRMERYRGLVGGMRRLGERMRAWLGGAQGVNPFPPGTTAHEAWHEVEKHVALLEVRHARLAGGVLDDVAAGRVRQEIAALEGKLSEYRQVVEDALESGVYVPGRGWVGQDPQGPLPGDRIPGRVQSRINVRLGDGSNSSGLEYAWRRHGGVDWPVKSQFSISKDELTALLQSEVVVRTSAVRVPSGNFVREVDVGRVIGNLPLDRGAAPTSIITVITDGAGNLVNTFPGKLYH
jgi:hypothetical protein